MNLGIVGTGSIVHEVLPVLAEKKEISLTAICSTPHSEPIMQKLRDTYQIAEGYTNYQQMLDESHCDTIYVALPNHLHYEYARLAMSSGRHAIVEKPITSHVAETRSLAKLAKCRHLFLFEAITTMYSAHYKKILELLPRIGKIKLISCNFSQYSRRYDDFLAGRIAPVFNPDMSGGVLMDLNSYNIWYVCGILGAPLHVSYHTTMEQRIDTGGILVMDYHDCNAVCIASKSSSAPCNCQIQGTNGYLLQNSPANFCGPVTLHLNDQTVETYDLTPYTSPDAPNHAHRMSAEFDAFSAAIQRKDYELRDRMLNMSIIVSEVLTNARKTAGLHFCADDLLPFA